MNTRQTVALAAASLVVLGGAGTAVAQSADTAGSSDLGAGSLQGGSLDGGSLQGGSANTTAPTTTPGVEKHCDLPNLGGSVAKVYPLLGITGIPSIIVTLATGALDSFPNALEMLGVDGQLTQLGSLEGPMCGTVFGGSMTATTVSTTTSTSASGTTATSATSKSSSTAPTSNSTMPTSSPAKSPLGSLNGASFGS